MSEEIPSLSGAVLSVNFTRSTEIASGIVYTPRQPALHRDDGIDRPTLQQLCRGFHGWNRVCERICKPLPDIKFARAVQISHVVRIDRIYKPPVIRRHRKCMSVGVA